MVGSLFANTKILIGAVEQLQSQSQSVVSCWKIHRQTGQHILADDRENCYKSQGAYFFYFKKKITTNLWLLQ